MEMIESYTQTFKNLSYRLPSWMMCENMSLCSKNKSVAVNKFKYSRCLEGSEYWCASWDKAKECKVIIKLNLSVNILFCEANNLTNGIYIDLNLMFRVRNN